MKELAIIIILLMAIIRIIILYLYADDRGLSGELE